MPQSVSVLVLHAVVPLDLGIAAQVLSYPEAPYDVSYCAARAGRVPTTAGFAVHVAHGLSALSEADMVVVPGFAPHSRDLERSVLRALRAAYLRGARMVSICTGAFALAQAGALDGRRAATHWMHADELARTYPSVQVDPEVLYVDDGQVLTSAGVAAGADLLMHIIRTDHGASAAAAVARRIVMAPHREGGQAQYIERPLANVHGTSLASTCSWVLGRLAEPVSVADMARNACMSERTFARRFVAETGTTPLRWLSNQRVAMACQLLEQTSAPVDEVARRSGLGSSDNLRVQLRRHLTTTPTGYRRAFSSPNPPSLLATATNPP